MLRGGIKELRIMKKLRNHSGNVGIGEAVELFRDYENTF